MLISPAGEPAARLSLRSSLFALGLSSVRSARLSLGPVGPWSCRPMVGVSVVRWSARMAKRQLQSAWVERVVASPDLVENDDVDSKLEHRLGKVPELTNRVLRGYRNQV